MESMDKSEELYFVKTCALVVCGGKSSRMGTDKSMLKYFGKPQRYHAYNLLNPLCEKVVISCNAGQIDTMEPGYSFLPDFTEYDNMGPVAALLTAFSQFPGKHILLVGCDYPFLTKEELTNFSSLCNTATPAAFFNEEMNCFEPMLAWYPSHSFSTVKKMVSNGQFSLQYFLKENNSAKYYPNEKTCIKSVDTLNEFLEAISSIKS